MKKTEKIEDSVIKYVINPFILKKEIDDIVIKDIRIPFRLKKEIDDN